MTSQHSHKRLKTNSENSKLVNSATDKRDLDSRDRGRLPEFQKETESVFEAKRTTACTQVFVLDRFRGYSRPYELFSLQEKSIF
jgi:hypothetical protein